MPAPADFQVVSFCYSDFALCCLFLAPSLRGHLRSFCPLPSFLLLPQGKPRWPVASIEEQHLAPQKAISVVQWLRGELQLGSQKKYQDTLKGWDFLLSTFHIHLQISECEFDSGGRLLPMNVCRHGCACVSVSTCLCSIVGSDGHYKEHLSNLLAISSYSVVAKTGRSTLDISSTHGSFLKKWLCLFCLKRTHFSFEGAVDPLYPP